MIWEASHPQAPGWGPEGSIPAAPPDPPAASPQTGCLGQLHGGLFLYQGLLQALAGISPEVGPSLTLLQLDVADFATNIWQQVSHGGKRHVLGTETDLVPQVVLATWGLGGCTWGATTPSQDPPAAGLPTLP